VPRDLARARSGAVASTSRRSSAPSAGHLRRIAGGRISPASRFLGRGGFGSHVVRSSTLAGGDFGEARRRRMLERTLEECEVDECKLEFAFDASALARAEAEQEKEELEASEEDEEDEPDGPRDDRLQKDGVHTAIFDWLVHRMPGQVRTKLPSIVHNETDNKSTWALAFCGFLWTSSTCMVFSLLPVFLKTELGYSNTRIGAMEGASLLLSNLSRVISGVLSDVIKSRVKVIAFGSAMTAAMKLVLASAISPQWVVSAKLLDRFGKGVRAAPTDALLADLSPRTKRSTTYGLHQSLTTLGGVFGSMCAVACMTLTHNNYRLTFTLAAVPSVFAIFMLLYYVSTPNRLQTKHYGMPKYPARPAPSKKRHGRGPLAMVYEPVRWRRSACKDKSRDLAYIRGKRTWRRVGEWLAEHLEEMKRRAQRFKEKRPGEKLFPQLRRQEGEPEEDWQTRQREWEAEYLSAEAELKYRSRRTFRRALTSANYPLSDASADGSSIASALITNAKRETNNRGRNAVGVVDAAGGVVTSGAPARGGAEDGGIVGGEKALASVPSVEKKVAWGAWRWSFREAVMLPTEFWRALLVFTVLKVARFSEAFVTLHANAVGLPAAYLPMLMVATNLMQSLLTYPLGVIADSVGGGTGRKFMLLGGFAMMIVADLVLVTAKSPWQVFLGYLAVGVHMSMTQANMKAALSATMPPNVRGTGFAISALSQGIALGFGNIMAGRLCDLFGSSGAFWGGGAFATAALGLGWLLL
jgi:MFS family permease